MTYPPPYYPNPQAQAPVRRWWQHPALIISLLVLIPPVGIALAWLSPWSQVKKVVATVLAGLWFLTPFLGDPPKKTAADAKPQPAATQPVAATATPPAAASTAPTPTKSPDPQMPAVVGKPFREAEKAVEDLIDKELTALSAYNDVELPAAYTDWIACFQSPGEGTMLVPKDADTSVHLVAPGTRCPAEKNTTLRPKPTPTPTPPPAPTPTPEDDDDTSSGGSSTGGGSAGTVTPGAFCSTPGATGIGKKNGRLYTCKGPGQERWRP
ncbi:hypothetical protein ACFYZ4_18185 [Streptomyces sp. NPDC001513]|uniref:hypothetical protein n=1 Tax=Streptomyces sp. NPDC001513 TaxID=3364580 RepID=UPI0036926EDE